MNYSQELVKVSGRIQAYGTRCVLELPDHSGVVLLKCPGLGASLLRDTDGIRVTSGTPMIDVRCELTGRFLDDAVPPFGSMFGDIAEIIVYSESGEAIQLDVNALQNLNAAQREDCEYFERRDKNTELRQRYLRERDAW